MLVRRLLILSHAHGFGGDARVTGVVLFDINSREGCLSVAHCTLQGLDGTYYDTVV